MGCKGGMRIGKVDDEDEGEEMDEFIFRIRI